MSKAAKGRKALKIVSIGEGRTGKTSLLRRFLTNTFDESEESTLEAKMHNEVKMEIDGKIVTANFCDTAGQERFRALAPIYYRDADGAIIVYDITDKDSFTRVRIWMRELHQVVGDSVSIVVIGNKCDLERERKVSKKEAEDWCNEHGATHITASAKLNLRVSEAFNGIVQKIVKARGDAAGGAGAGGNGGGAGGRGGGGVGGDIMFGRPSRPTGVTVTLDEPMNRGTSGGGGGGSSGGGGSGGKPNGGGCPC